MVANSSTFPYFDNQYLIFETYHNFSFSHQFVKKKKISFHLNNPQVKMSSWLCHNNLLDYFFTPRAQTKADRCLKDARS